jgi:hypothetical protein
MEFDENTTMGLSVEDQMARISAVLVLRTPHDKAILSIATTQSIVLADERSKVMKVTMVKIGSELDQPCKWVQKLVDASLPIGRKTKWGFVALRDARTKCSDEAWNVFLKEFERFVHFSVKQLVGGSKINQTRKLVWWDEFVDEDDREGLYRYTII